MDIPQELIEKATKEFMSVNADIRGSLEQAITLILPSVRKQVLEECRAGCEISKAVDLTLASARRAALEEAAKELEFHSCCCERVIRSPMKKEE